MDYLLVWPLLGWLLLVLLVATLKQDIRANTAYAEHASQLLVRLASRPGYYTLGFGLLWPWFFLRASHIRRTKN